MDSKATLQAIMQQSTTDVEQHQAALLVRYEYLTKTIMEHLALYPEFKLQATLAKIIDPIFGCDGMPIGRFIGLITHTNQQLDFLLNRINNLIVLKQSLEDSEEKCKVIIMHLTKLLSEKESATYIRFEYVTTTLVKRCIDEGDYLAASDIMLTVSNSLQQNIDVVKAISKRLEKMI